MIKLESLANEILLDIFEFLNGVHLLRTFHGLNSRFDNLLFTYFRFNSLDFRSASKIDFDIVCQQHLPTFLDQIIPLYLSNDDKTPQQTQCFLRHNLTLRQFNRLQTLSLSDIGSREIMDKMMGDLCDLPYLQSLSVIRCDFCSEYLDRIWCLSRLTHCNLNSIDDVDWSAVPTVTSLSLVNLSILSNIDQRSSLERLLKSTPHLRRFAFGLLDGHDSEQLSFMMPSIEILKFSFEKCIYGFENIIQHLPNLSRLIVQTPDTYVDGYQWKKMIINYLPKLKTFRLLMDFGFEDNLESEEHVDQILNSFQTRFWIDEHQWFVRCHWGLRYESKCYCVYTLPYSYPWFHPSVDMQFKSTCINDDNHFYSYNRVNSLHYGFCPSTDFLRIHFSNVQHLSLKLPFREDFSSVLPAFDRLNSLSISFSDDAIARSQLQTLLNKSSHLYSLELYSRQSTLHVLPIDITSKSIRRLDFRLNDPCFTEETSAKLCNSPLGIQCEILWIKVSERKNIVYLVKNLKNLRTLNVYCRDDIWLLQCYSNPLRYIEDELVKWLKQCLPSTCTISRSGGRLIRLWIR